MAKVPAGTWTSPSVAAGVEGFPCPDIPTPVSAPVAPLAWARGKDSLGVE
ncbi:hypothetical protein ANMWB30_14440 [Arthrobacter sp. MWB30]|nr:hypothetical protein ANMWB30_14440 [Arthrobacter sp. MWB30]